MYRDVQVSREGRKPGVTIHAGKDARKIKTNRFFEFLASLREKYFLRIKTV